MSHAAKFGARSAFGSVRYHKSRIREFLNSTIVQYFAEETDAGDAFVRVHITLRLDGDLLTTAGVKARRDSRTLTDLIEVVLNTRIGQIQEAELKTPLDMPSPAVANAASVAANSTRKDLR